MRYKNLSWIIGKGWFTWIGENHVKIVTKIREGFR